MNYREYIKSDKWREFRKKAIVAAGLACARCGAKNKVLQVHHLHYSTLGHESLSDVQLFALTATHKLTESVSIEMGFQLSAVRNTGMTMCRLFLK